MTHTALSIARPNPVLRDNTARTRASRQAVRGTVHTSPLALVMLVLLPFSWLTGAAIANGLILALVYSLAYIDQTGERRLVKHGYEPGTLALTLHERYLRENEDEIAQYMATYRHDNGRLAW